MNFFPFIHIKKKEEKPIQIPLHIEKPIPEKPKEDEEKKENEIVIELF